MKPHVAIAIDGPAASGKSTLARQLAARLGVTMVNSGEMYRAITWKILGLGIDPADAVAVARALESMQLECGVEERVSTIAIDGVRPTAALRSEPVNRAVSLVAAIPAVRERLIGLQRHFLEFTDVVMEGRDIGSVIFPETPFKIYVDADVEIRAQRRVKMGEVDAVATRDKEDSSRQTAPLTIPEGAAILDTSKHSVESGVEAALAILRAQGLELEER